MKSAPRCVLSSSRERAIDCEAGENDHRFRMFDLAPSLSFGFFEGQLWTSRVDFYFEEEVRAGAAFSMLREKLTKKYGKPWYENVSNPTSGELALGRVEWKTPGMTVELDLTIAPGHINSVNLSYQDPIRCEQFLHAPIAAGQTR